MQALAIGDAALSFDCGGHERILAAGTVGAQRIPRLHANRSVMPAM
jgi:hypothetical protein